MSGKHWLIAAGSATLLGAVAHLAIIVGGPDSYRFFGAPEPLVQMAAQGHWYPVAACVVIAGVLLIWAGYAFSGAGLVRRWPFRRFVLAAISLVLVARGLLFIPLALWWPEALGVLCNCRGVDAFLITTSALCLAVGAAYAIGTWRAWNWLVA